MDGHRVEEKWSIILIHVFGGGELVRLPPGGDVMCLNAYPSLN